MSEKTACGAEEDASEDRLEIAIGDLKRTRNALLEISYDDPDGFGALLRPAARIEKALIDLRRFLSPGSYPQLQRQTPGRTT